MFYHTCVRKWSCIQYKTELDFRNSAYLGLQPKAPSSIFFMLGISLSEKLLRHGREDLFCGKNAGFSIQSLMVI